MFFVKEDEMQHADKSNAGQQTEVADDDCGCGCGGNCTSAKNKHVVWIALAIVIGVAVWFFLRKRKLNNG